MLSTYMQPVLGFSHALVQVLRISPKSILAYVIHLTTAFFISAFFHIWSLSVVADGYISQRDLIYNLGAFFMTQPIATIMEAILIHYFQTTLCLRGRHALKSIDKAHRGGSGGVSQSTSMIIRGLGYIWVASWFVFTGWWFVKPYYLIGVAEWPLPFSVWRIIMT